MNMVFIYLCIVLRPMIKVTALKIRQMLLIAFFMNYRFLLLIIIIFISSCAPPGYLRTKRLVFYEDRREEIVETAKKYLGSMYLEGGSGPERFDCSGFTKFVYRESNLNIPRNALDQFYSGKRVDLEYALPGDLIFFRINSYRISHVGIYTGNSRFIHSPSEGKKVTFSSLKNRYWKRRYAGTVTYFAGDAD